MTDGTPINSDTLANPAFFPSGRLVPVQRIINEGLAELLNPLGDTPPIATGFAAIDELFLGGLRSPEVMILAARPGIGKTTLALNIALNVAASGHTVDIFSLEMPSHTLLQKMLCCKGGLDYSDFIRGKFPPGSPEYTNLNAEASNLSNLPINIDDLTDLSLETFDRVLKSRRTQPGLTILDYLGLMVSGASSNRANEVSGISRGLILLAKKYHQPLLVLCQLNRMSEMGDDKEPELHHLRDSGAIEQDAWKVAFLYQQPISDEETEYGGGDPNMRNVIFKLAKNRIGPLGKVYMKFHARTGKFMEE